MNGAPDCRLVYGSSSSITPQGNHESQSSCQSSIVNRQSSIVNRQSSIALAAGLVIAASGLSAQAASADPLEYEKLVKEARASGLVPVVVDLELLSLADISKHGKALGARMNQRASQLLAELGTHAVADSAWGNGVGQFEVHVTEQGLQLLRGSSNAQAFRAGKAWSARTALAGFDGRHSAIQAALSRDGYVDVEVVTNVDGMEFDLPSHGRAVVSPSTHRAAMAKAGDLLAALSDRHAHNLPSAAAQVAAADATQSTAQPLGAGANAAVTLRLTRAGVLKLASSPHVRSMRPVGHTDARPLDIDAEALSAATKDGSADVIVTLRNPIFGGALTRASRDAQARSQRSALQQMLSSAQVDHSKWTDLSVFGAMAGRMSLAQLNRLVASADKRLLSVALNKPMARSSLATSTTTMNMPSAWNLGYRAAGQHIIVMDSGTQANHDFFRGDNGASRVVFEACFGTNAVSSGVTYQSVCPNPDSNGDSPLGIAGSAAPVAACAGGAVPAECDHGTHVAGIAAGRNGAATPPGLQGVAPDAFIVAVQVNSFDAARQQPPRIFTHDLVAAMAAAANAMVVGTTTNPYVVNLSLGGGSHGAPCGSLVPTLSNAVLTLKNAGVPVVAATGNDNYIGAVNWPACVPGVVQASSVANDGVGNSLSYFGTSNGVTSGANIARPSQFPVEYIWLAPGGGNGTSVVSSVISAPSYPGTGGGPASYRGLQGTSYAAPHVAGLYAALKAGANGISVDGASEWIRANARVGVPIGMCGTSPCAPSETVIFDRIRLRDL